MFFSIVYTVIARMKLKISTCCLFLALVGLAKFASVPNSGDTSEYLRLLAGIKSGTVTLPGQNMSAIPWVYTSQGLKFEEKLKVFKFYDNKFAAFTNCP